MARRRHGFLISLAHPAFAALLIVFSFAYLAVELRQGMLNQQENRARELQFAARATAVAAEGAMLVWEKVFAALAESPCARTKNDESCRQLFAGLKKRFPEASNLVAIDRHGDYYASLQNPAVLPYLNARGLSLFTELAAGRQRYLAEPHVGPISGQWVAAMTTRATDGAGHFDGAFGVSVAVSSLYQQSVPDAEAGASGIQYAIINRAGKIIYAGEDQKRWPKTSLPMPGNAGDTWSPAQHLFFSDPDASYHGHAAMLDDGQWGFLAYERTPGQLDALITGAKDELVFFFPMALLAILAAAVAVRSRRSEYALVASDDALRRVLNETERTVQQRTQQLAGSEALYRALFEQAPGGIVLLDAGGNILEFNANATQLTGFAAAELRGLNLSHLDATRTPEQSRAFIAEIIDDGGAQKEILARRKDGSTYPILLNARPVTGPEGESPRLLLFWSDLSEQRASQERLRLTQKMEAVGILAGGVAHDFNNLLAIVMGHAQLAHDAAAADSPIRGYTEKITKAVLRARAIIKQLLDFSRSTDEAPRAMSLAVELGEIETLLQVSQPRHIALRFSIEPATSAIYAVPHQVQQVIINLINNACDAIGEPAGEVEVSLSEETRGELDGGAGSVEGLLVGALTLGRYAVLRVRDTGPGISAAQMPQIFVPFFTTKDVGRGTGLGLAVVRGIIEELGGAIAVHSRPSGGTCFELFFPAINASPMAAADQTVHDRGHGETILMVDDEPEVVEAYLEYLKNAGFVPLFAASGEQALRLATVHGSDIRAVVSDLLMPNMDGMALAAALGGVLPGVPVLLLTGRGESLQASQLAAHGVSGLIAKPVEPQIIAGELRRVIDLSAAPPR